MARQSRQKLAPEASKSNAKAAQRPAAGAGELSAMAVEPQKPQQKSPQKPVSNGKAGPAAVATGDKSGKSGKKAAPVKGQAAKGQAAKGGGITPSMAQFLEIKAANPDCLLFYRMGDFYEMFFEDAVAAAKAISLTLTKRGKHLGEDIPMCGVPVVRADEYLQRLIRCGFRVAVCEQLEDPAEARKRGGKAIVRRDVVRLVTPGTLTEDSLLEAASRNYLTALLQAPKSATGGKELLALASMDISTGEFEVGEVAASDLPGELLRLSPSEIIAADQVFADADKMRWIEVAGAATTPVPKAYFDKMAGERALKAGLGVSELAAFGDFSRFELAAIGALLKYIDLTQLGAKPVLRPPRKCGPAEIMVIDASSRASLEILRSSSGDRQGSLLAAIDRTVTGPGARELAARLASPLRQPQPINARLDALGYLLERDALRDDLRSALKLTPDIARALSRLAFNRGGPRDLAALRDGLAASASCAGLLDKSAGAMGLPQDLHELTERLKASRLPLAAKLEKALVDEPPQLRRDGNFIRQGYSSELDEARRLRDDGRKVMAGLQADYIKLSGIKTLKIRHNNILGFFIEVTAGNAGPMMRPPLSDTFRHRQTMANAVRFSTPELVEIEGRIASAGERAVALEQEIFGEIATEIAANEQLLTSLAGALAGLDAETGLAQLAYEENYVRPELDDSAAFEIIGGRHPVVEQALRRANEGPFIDNDCLLGRFSPAPTGFDEDEAAHIWLVTGPNMAGKSTFLRQNALITLLAQIGSYVPAKSARLGVVDRLFSRVGAADDLARGRSTFMVEMVETAGILNQASDRSLVILDEIGRGTATFDGLSIAWATVEYLHDVNKCRCLFATHYHEMTALSERLAHVANVTIDVKEWRETIVFLHKVKPGAADRSYGIQVAKLAGLPARVVARAGEVLKLLEQSDGAAAKAGAQLDDLPLFAAAARPQAHIPQALGPAQTQAQTQAGGGSAAAPSIAQAKPPAPSLSDAALSAMDPDEMTPRDALEALYKLKDLSRTAQNPDKDDGR